MVVWLSTLALVARATCCTATSTLQLASTAPANSPTASSPAHLGPPLTASLPSPLISPTSPRHHGHRLDLVHLARRRRLLPLHLEAHRRRHRQGARPHRRMCVPHSRRLWSLVHPVRRLTRSSSCLLCTGNMDGRRLAAGGTDKSVRIYLPDKGALRFLSPSPSPSPPADSPMTRAQTFAAGPSAEGTRATSTASGGARCTRSGSRA